VLRAGRVFIENFLPREWRADHRAAVGGMWDVIGSLQLPCPFGLTQPAPGGSGRDRNQFDWISV
jgi:hypothetical protein